MPDVEKLITMDEPHGGRRKTVGTYKDRDLKSWELKPEGEERKVDQRNPGKDRYREFVDKYVQEALERYARVLAKSRGIKEIEQAREVAMGNEVLVEFLRKEARYFVRLKVEHGMDSLTKNLLDLKSFEAIYIDQLKQFEKTAREDEVLVFIAFDIDKFKPKNEKYGHKGGDEILKKVARVLKGNIYLKGLQETGPEEETEKGILRITDKAARMGGDEFGILLSGLKEGDVSMVVLKIINELSKIKLSLKNRHTDEMEDVGIELSVGVKIIKKGESPAFDEARHDSDSLLSVAKIKGRKQNITERKGKLIRISGDKNNIIEEELDEDMKDEKFYQRVQIETYIRRLEDVDKKDSRLAAQLITGLRKMGTVDFYYDKPVINLKEMLEDLELTGLSDDLLEAIKKGGELGEIAGEIYEEIKGYYLKVAKSKLRFYEAKERLAA